MSKIHTRSKAVEHALGWVATKIGLFDISDFSDGPTTTMKSSLSASPKTREKGLKMKWIALFKYVVAANKQS